MLDIKNRLDIENLMSAFYNKLLADKSIAYVFTDVAKINLPEHLPHLTDFWAQNILGLGSYRKNVLQIHLELDKKENLTRLHFETWLNHFHRTVDENFKGNNAELIKTRAQSIATIMLIKLSEKQD